MSAALLRCVGFIGRATLWARFDFERVSLRAERGSKYGPAPCDLHHSSLLRQQA